MNLFLLTTPFSGALVRRLKASRLGLRFEPSDLPMATSAPKPQRQLTDSCTSQISWQAPARTEAIGENLMNNYLKRKRLGLVFWSLTTLLLLLSVSIAATPKFGEYAGTITFTSTLYARDQYTGLNINKTTPVIAEFRNTGDPAYAGILLILAPNTSLRATSFEGAAAPEGFEYFMVDQSGNIYDAANEHLTINPKVTATTFSFYLEHTNDQGNGYNIAQSAVVKLRLIRASPYR